MRRILLSFSLVMLSVLMVACGDPAVSTEEMTAESETLGFEETQVIYKNITAAEALVLI